jgi:hypothetical protein
MTDVSEESIASTITVKRIIELGTTLAATAKKHYLYEKGSRPQLLGTANIVPSSLSLFTLMMEKICFSETSILTRATRRHITEEDILYMSLVLHTISIMVKNKIASINTHLESLSTLHSAFWRG